MAAYEEITAIYCRELHRWPNASDGADTVICECELPPNGQTKLFEGPPRIQIKTEATVDDFEPRLSYRFFGTWSNYTNKRTGETVRQLRARTFVRTRPHGQAGTVRYLMNAPNIGRARAQKLWNKFQGDAVRILRETPEIAAAAVGDRQFNEDKAKQSAAYLQAEQRLESCSIDLIDLLGGRGFPKVTSKKAVAKWGNLAADRIRELPYRLMRFRGCGFLKCDQMYLDMGCDPHWIGRQAASAWYTVARDTNGHTWFDTQFLEYGNPQNGNRGIRGMIGGTAVNPPKALKLAKRAGVLATRRDVAGKLWIAESKNDCAEARLAESAAAMMQADGNWPDVASLDVSDHQREQLAAALKSQLAIFRGSPGTGKTYTSARLISAIIDQHGSEAVAVCALTNKAAIRLSEALAEYEVPARGTTIHRLLGVASRVEGEGWGFVHHEDNPLPYRYLIVDEVSMVGCGLMSTLFAACAPGTHVLLIGDTNQLPPVEYGAPFRDLIAAGVPTGSLTEIQRNSGTIVKACASIRDHGRFDIDSVISPASGNNLGLLPADGNEAIADRIVQACANIRRQNLADPVWDCQVVVATNNLRKTLNLQLQEALNAGGTRATGNPFRFNDKIVCRDNGWLPISEADAPSSDDEDSDDEEETTEVFVAKGELGRVLRVEPKLTIAEFSSPKRIVKIPRSNGGDDKGDDGESKTGCKFDLGYAMTCHYMQGSETPIVFVALDPGPGARMVTSKEWAITAFSRAKRVCYLVGKKETADGMCRREKLSQRKTFLVERIQEALA